MAKLERCLVGGTFDRFHAGHQALLNTALDIAELVEVWIANDAMSDAKSPFIQPFEDRREAILVWADERITTHELTDADGPAPFRKDCDSIICTPETLGNCQSINEKRLGNGLLPLEIIEAPYCMDDGGGIISSSRIRAGLINREGKLWLNNDERAKTYQFQPQLDAELKEPAGELFLGPEDVPEVAMSAAMEHIAPGSLIAVGDVSVATLLDMDIVPDIALVDGMTKRTELEDKVDLSPFDVLIDSINPAGQITPSLIDSIDAALHNDQTTCIEVEGEEDLAPIIIHLLAPLGTNVIYGQPGKGVVLRITEFDAKEHCRRILSRFEVIN
ncbi:MAG: pantetheine-phosphate adenylyltransferase [Euryarchaeota archaeon]|jgi:cytidyltransferase-like protein|nr:pantetheine-phosphate adenylyltransferase [Euryarchaeota archaeon]MBT4982065.1 pantetheine-phosphate adenylyltransferase [Euryarchaeota archaeon]